jgi:hypothetical protein
VPTLEGPRYNAAAMQANEAAWYDQHYQQIQTAESAGFRIEQGIGSGYGPPFFYRFEKDWMTRALNALGQWRMSFHPILVFRKPAPVAAGKKL